MVVGQEVVEGVGVGRSGIDVPDEKRSDGVSAHQTVDQASNLVAIPYELALDRRQQIFLAVNPAQYLFHRNWCLKAQS